MVQTFLSQLPTLIGVALGAIGALASTALTDRLRWRRSQLTRWDERRLDAYIAFAATLKEIHTIAYRLTSVHRPAGKAPPIDRDAGLALIAQANIQRTKDWETLLLLGSETTVAAGRRWRDAMSDVERLARADGWDLAVWRATIDEVDSARDEFYVAARQSLGVRGGSVAQLPFLREKRA